MTRSHQRRCFAVGAAVALGLALAAPVQGQQSATTTVAAFPEPGSAEALRQEAAELYTSPKSWERVAELRAEAAQVAPLEDPVRAEDLWYAGAILAEHGRLAEAHTYLTQAAEVALAFGDLPSAANAYVGASVVAIRLGAFDTSKSLLARADLLAHSPLMPDALCECIETRVAILSEEVAKLENRLRN